MDDKELIQALRMCKTGKCAECLGVYTVCRRRQWLSDAADRLEVLLNKQVLYQELDEGHQQLEQAFERECHTLKYQIELLRV